MNEKIISLYDISGIQQYIFCSNKLKENIGASIIVQQIFEEFFVEILKAHKLTENEKVILSWKEQEDFSMLKDKEIKAEIIYIGGGNAMIAYDNPDIMKEINEEFSKKLLEITGGELKVNFAYIYTTFSNFYEDIKELYLKINEEKQRRTNKKPLKGIGITREGITDGLPASFYENDELISLSANKKREYNDNNYFETKILKEELKEYIFPKEIEIIGGEENKSYISIIHIDGDGMGEMIEKLIDNNNSYEKNVQTIRIFSSEIEEIYIETMFETVKKINNADNAENKILKIRPIVINGDDVTFVCKGKLGISAAENFLKILNSKILSINNNQHKISACAGVAIVKTKFPFYIAYEMAEELCNNAKQKRLGEKSKKSWLDFHIHNTGSVNELEVLRESIYNIISDSEKYNLLWRPYVIDEDSKYCFENFKNIHKEFMLWPRSKVNEIRNVFWREKEKSSITLLRILSRDNTKKLPIFEDFNGDNIFNQNNKTIYFDPIELIDYFEEIEGEK